MAQLLNKSIRTIYLICTFLFLTMTLVLFINAVLRYLVGLSIIWAEEVSMLCMVWIVFLGSIIATLKLSHTRITFFINKIREDKRKYIVGLVSIATAAVSLLISYYGINVVKVSMLSRSTGLGYPLVILYLSAPLSCLVMAVIFFIQGVLQIQGKYPLDVSYDDDKED